MANVFDEVLEEKAKPKGREAPEAAPGNVFDQVLEERRPGVVKRAAGAVYDASAAPVRAGADILERAARAIPDPETRSAAANFALSVPKTTLETVSNFLKTIGGGDEKKTWDKMTLPSRVSQEGLDRLVEATSVIPEPKSRSALLNFMLLSPRAAGELFSELSAASLHPISVAAMSVPAGAGGKAMAIVREKAPKVAAALEYPLEKILKPAGSDIMRVAKGWTLTPEQTAAVAKMEPQAVEANKAAQAELPAFKKYVTDFVEKYGGKFKEARVKRTEDMLGKVARKFNEGTQGYDVLTMKDHVGSRIILPSEEALPAAIDELKAAGWTPEIVQNKTGYYGLHMSKRTPSGISMEIQLQTPKSSPIYDVTHDMFSEFRKSNILKLTKEEQAAAARAGEQSKAAWDNYLAGISPETRAAISESMSGLAEKNSPTVTLGLTSAAGRQTPSLRMENTSGAELSMRPTIPFGSLPNEGAIKPPPSNLSIPEIAEKFKAGVPPPTKDFFGQQVEKFAVSDDARSVLAQTSEAFKGQINESRRGVQTWRDTAKLADDLGMTFQDLLKFNKGQPMNAEQIEAAKGLVGASMEQVNAAREAYAALPTAKNLLDFEGAIAQHAAIQERFYGARAELGRAMNIMRKVTAARSLPEEAQQAALESIRGNKVSKEILARLAAIDPNDIAAINKFIRDVTKAKTSDQIFEFYMNNILSNPLTHKANVEGNLLFAAMKVPEKVANAAIDYGISKFTGKRTAYLGEAPREAYSLLSGIKNGVRKGLLALRSGPSETKLETSNIPAIKGKIGEIIRTPSKMLVAEDEFAKGVIYEAELSAQAYRVAKSEGLKGKAFAARIAELKTNPTPAMESAIHEESLYRTFQNDPGKAINSLIQLREHVPLMRYIVPFIKTPANVTARAIERSPLGVIKLVSQIAGKAGQEEIAKTAGQTAIGSLIAGAVALEAASGNVTGAPPRDPAQRDKFYREGKMPFSVRVGGKWYSYARREPLSLIIGGVAQAIQNAKEAGGEPDKNVVGAIVSSIPQYLLNQTFLSGLRDFFDATTDPERYGENFLKRQAGAMLPASAFMRFMAQIYDPIVRQKNTVGESVKATIPGLSKELLPQRNAFGEPAKRPNDLFSVAVTPRSKETIGPLEKQETELDRPTPLPEKKIAGVTLLPEEMDQLRQISGRFIKNAEMGLLKNKGYMSLTGEAKAKILGSLELAARSEAKRRIIGKVIARSSPEEKRKLREYAVKFLKVDMSK